MLDETCYVFLTDIKGPDVTDLIKDANDVLDELGYEEHTLLIEQELSNALAAEADSGITADNIHTIVFNGLLYHISLMGITPSDDISLANTIILINALINIEYYEDRAQLAGILNTDDLPLDKMVSILAAITQANVNDVAFWVSDVAEDLLDRVAELLIDDTVETEEVFEIIGFERKLSYIKQLSETYKDLGTATLLDQLPFCKVPVLTLLELPTQAGDGQETVRELLQVVVTESTTRAASLLHMLYVFDSTTTVETVLDINQYTFLDAVFDDPVIISRVYSTLKKLLEA